MVSQCSFDLHFSNDQWWWAFFSCLLASYMSSFEKYLFISFTHFWMGFFSFISVLVLCRFWISALCQMGKCKNFFPFCWLPLHSNDCFFCCEKKLLGLIRSHLSILAFVAIAFGVLVMKSLLIPMSWMVLPRFSSRVYMVLGLMFKYLIYLELIFV